MKYVSEVEISRKDFERINNLFDVDFDDCDENGDLNPDMEDLIDKLDARQDATPYSFKFYFEDGSCITMDIRSGQNSYYDDCVFYNKDVMQSFDCGFEICEENEFFVGDNTYICKFSIKEEQEKRYKITYTETLVHEFFVDAESETEAKEKFEQGLTDGEFDLTHGYTDETEYKIEEEI